MAQLQKGHTYNPGDVVDATDLNALVDAATGISGLIVDQGPVSLPIQPGLDKLLIYDNSAPPPNRLRSCTVDQLAAGTVTSLTFVPPTLFNFTGSNPVTTLATWTMSWQNQGINKVLAGPVSGSNGPPTFRALAPADLPIATVPVGALLIDWSLGNCFSKSVTATAAMTFSNPTEGQTITLLVSNTGAFNLTFPTGTSGVRWAGNTVYAATQGAGKHDILIFRYIGGHYYGNYFLNFV